MTTRNVICTLLATTLVVAWLRADEPAPGLDGRWIVTRLVIDGTELPVSKSSDTFWFDVDGDAWRYSFVVDGKRTTARFRVTLARNDTEISVDAKLLNGAYADRVCKGICRIDGDVTQLCLADKPSIARPISFECPAKSGLQLFELRRAKTTELIQ
jgi:uncharacterized protein (TIGR03067 family)